MISLWSHRLISFSAWVDERTLGLTKLQEPWSTSALFGELQSARTGRDAERIITAHFDKFVGYYRVSSAGGLRHYLAASPGTKLYHPTFTRALVMSSENCVTMSTCPRDNRGPKSFKTVLVLSGDSLVRTAIVQLLRDCGYRVVEAESTDRAIGIMRHRDILVDVVMSEIVIPGSVNGFEFAKWARLVRPDLKIMLAGTPERMARNAAELSQVGPMQKRTYEHELMVERMKRGLWPLGYSSSKR